ncbi:glycosyltransferase family 4 protein [Thauera sinica]|uniref:Glycosyltransferase family 4 protein n=1 Tax=Thauera sinica TaxID=2665146 RepID=A0ABW1AM48_9RHOO|nr:glycosyltransferase family 4 protein [Thauera sp. K11]ATE60927.1 glycosyltransferase [Thauera sp. K11]
MMPEKNRITACFITGSAGDWGGASRVIYTLLRRLPRERIDPLVLLPGDGPVAGELEASGIRFRLWGALTELELPSPWRYVSALVRAMAFFRRHRVRVVHVNHSGFWRAAEILAARLLGIPVIAHYHVVNARPAPGMAWCAKAVAVSDYVARMSGPAGLEKCVVYNPVDPGRFAAGRSLRPDLGIPDACPVAGFAGQIRDIKGVQDFIRMARMIDAPDAVFLIAGECRDPAKFPGSYTEPQLREMIGGDTRIRYLGYVERIEDVYATSDVMVVPSRWQEPLGLIAIEAGLMGRAVVATRVGGIPEVIVDGQTGCLFEVGEIGEMAACVAALLRDAGERARLGGSAQERVTRLFVDGPVREFEALLFDSARRA